MSPDDLKRILDAHAEWLRWGGERGKRFDLSGADLTNENMVGARLVLSIMRRTILTRAAMQDADLFFACLDDSVMTHSNLRNATMTCASLARVDLTSATMTHAVMNSVILHDATVIGADLSGATLDVADMTGARLAHAILATASLVRTTMRGAALTGADLTGAELFEADMNGIDLSDAIVSRADFAGADLTNAIMSGTVFDYADFSGCIGVYCAGEDRGPGRFLGIDHGDHAMVAAGPYWLTVDDAHTHWTRQGDADALAKVEKIAAWHKRLRKARNET